MFTDNVYLACRDPDYDDYTLPQHVLHVRVATPENYKAASNEKFDPHWVPSMAEEVDALVDNKTWDPEPVKVPPGAKVIKCRLVLILQEQI